MKCVLVIGGLRGIGSVICKKLVVEVNYYILINYYLNKIVVEEILQEVIKLGGIGEILGFDVLNFNDV